MLHFPVHALQGSQELSSAGAWTRSAGKSWGTSLRPVSTFLSPWCTGKDSLDWLLSTGMPAVRDSPRAFLARHNLHSCCSFFRRAQNRCCWSLFRSWISWRRRSFFFTNSSLCFRSIASLTLVF